MSVAWVLQKYFNDEISKNDLLQELAEVNNKTYFDAYSRGYNEGYKDGIEGKEHSYPDTKDMP